MAVQFNAEHSRTSEYRFLPQNIDIRPELNGRHDKPDVEWLIADILKIGQQVPVAIWSDAGTPVLASGFSRWRAVSEINKRGLTPKPLELRCTYIQCNEKGAFIRNISENRMRNPTSAIDDAHNINRLIEAWQMSIEEVALIYFPIAATTDEIASAVKWVSAKLELVKLTPESERAVLDGRLNESAAAAIAKLSSRQQREALASKEGKISAKDIKPSKPRAIKIDPELRRRITAVLESAAWETFDESKSLLIEVHADTLAALKNYIEDE